MRHQAPRLGKEGAKAYFDKGGMSWLKHLDNGDSVQFDLDNDAYRKKPIATL